MMAPSRGDTILDILHRRAIRTPEKIAFRFLRDGGIEADISYGMLSRLVRQNAEMLWQIGELGDRVVLAYPAGLEFVVAFLATLHAGRIAVPVALPKAQRGMQTFLGIVQNAKPAVIMSAEAGIRQLKAESRLVLDEIVSMAVDLSAGRTPAKNIETTAMGHSAAFLQYTSGSTGHPRGVIVTHGNLSENLFMIREAIGLGEDDNGFSWLPHYHDMGLIGGILTPIFSGFSATLMSPAAFASQPLSWLKLMSKYGSTISAAPNSAFEACSRVNQEHCVGLDLSRIRRLLCGAEPIRASTVEKFFSMFRPYGLREDAFFPCYGLAEATLMVSGSATKYSEAGTNFLAKSVECRNPTQAEQDAGHGLRLVASGIVDSALQLLIVDPDRRDLVREGAVGEIWISGPSVAAGYWQNQAETEAVFLGRLNDGRGPFLRTGDLGFICQGRLYISGRRKDLIIVGGRNLYPQDIEATVEQVDATIRTGSVAAFAIDGANGEGFAILLELNSLPAISYDDILRKIRQSVTRHHEIGPERIHIVRRGSVPHTSSGKIQRAKCRELLQSEGMPIIATWAAPAMIVQSGYSTVPRELIPAWLATLGLVERRLWLEQYLTGYLASLTSVDPVDLDLESVSLLELGLDSVQLVQAASQLQADLQLDLPLQVFWERGSVRSLAREICNLMENSYLRTHTHKIEALANHIAGLPEHEVDKLLRSLESPNENT